MGIPDLEDKDSEVWEYDRIFLRENKADYDKKIPATLENEPEINPFMIFDLVDKYSDDEIIEKFHHQDEDGALDENKIRMHLQHVRFLKSQK